MRLIYNTTSYIICYYKIIYLILLSILISILIEIIIWDSDILVVGKKQNSEDETITTTGKEKQIEKNNYQNNAITNSNVIQ